MIDCKEEPQSLQNTAGVNPKIDVGHHSDSVHSPRPERKPAEGEGGREGGAGGKESTVNIKN